MCLICEHVQPLTQRDEVLQESQGEGKGDVEWEPRRRVNAAVKKLHGINPAVLMLEDLEKNVTVRKEKSFEALSQIVRGACAPPSTEGRGDGWLRELKENLDVGEQVDALIRLATDPNVLMRQWVGLAAWI